MKKIDRATLEELGKGELHLFTEHNDGDIYRFVDDGHEVFTAADSRAETIEQELRRDPSLNRESSNPLNAKTKASACREKMYRTANEHGLEAVLTTLNEYCRYRSRLHRGESREWVEAAKVIATSLKKVKEIQHAARYRNHTG